MANFLQKAVAGILSTTPNPRKIPEGRGTLSGFALGVSPLWGQPYPEQMAEDASGLISRERMREIVLRTPTASACMNAILDFVGGVKIDVRNVDASKPVPKIQAAKVKRILTMPNPNQTRRQFTLTLVRDLVTFGYAAIELVKTNDLSKPVDMWVMDGARLRIDFDEHGLIRGYDMLNARGAPIIRPQSKLESINTSNLYAMPQGNAMGVFSNPSVLSYTDTSGEYNAAFGNNLHGWEPNEVIFLSLNPISESLYPHSRIVQLFSSAVLEDLMMQFISERFTDSNIPFGVFDLGDVTETELRLAIDNWNSQGKTGNRILMTGSKGAGSKFMPFGYHLKDLEATALLQEFRMKIMGILGVTAQELGESQDINKSNGYNLSFTFKKRAVEPMLEEITQTLTRRLLWDTLTYTDIELYFEEIDSRDDFLMSQIDQNYEKMAIITPNEVRNRRGQVSKPGGDDALLFTGNSWIPLDLVREYAEILIDVEKQTSAFGTSGAGGIRVRETIPSGSSGTTPSSAPGEPGSNANSNGHSRGASSELARNITGQK